MYTCKSFNSAECARLDNALVLRKGAADLDVLDISGCSADLLLAADQMSYVYESLF